MQRSPVPYLRARRKRRLDDKAISHFIDADHLQGSPAFGKVARDALEIDNDRAHHRMVWQPCLEISLRKAGLSAFADLLMTLGESLAMERELLGVWRMSRKPWRHVFRVVRIELALNDGRGIGRCHLRNPDG
jgi:hypothetical protein